MDIRTMILPIRSTLKYITSTLFIVMLFACDGEDDSVNTVPVESVTTNPSASTDIANIRTPASGSLSGAAVTYINTAIITGFFVQAEQPGSALFVSVDPASLSLAVGNIVDFDATTVTSTLSGVEVSAISDFTVTNTGFDVSSLTQDVSSATDLVSALDSYEHEMVSAQMSVTGTFSPAATGFLAATVDTAGISGNANLVLRLPITLQDQLGLNASCSMTVGPVPLWRYGATAQFSIASVDELSNVSCDAAVVEGVVATSETTIDILLTRAIDPSSITDATSQFVFDNGLSVSAAVMNGRTVTLTTDLQVSDATYNMTVATSIQDLFGTSIDGAGNTGTVSGYTPNIGFVINEVDYDQPGADTAEFVEIYNASDSTIDLSEYRLVFVNGADETVYMTVDSMNDILHPASYYTVGNAAVPGVDNVISNSTIQNGAPDGIRLEHIASGAVMDSLSYEGRMTTAGEAGGAIAADNADVSSLCRFPDGADTDNNGADFFLCPSATPGTSNSTPP